MKLHPDIKDFVIKINNEGKRTESQGWNLKLMGMHKGASDLYLAYPCHGFCGCWIEVKRNKTYCYSEKNTLTWKDEEAFQEKMKKIGYEAFFCFGWEDGKKKILEYLKNESN